MPSTNIDENTVMVITYGFVDFLQETYELVKQGYAFDFEDNQSYPQMIGHHFQAILKKVPESTEETSKEDKPKRGRPSSKE